MKKFCSNESPNVTVGVVLALHNQGGQNWNERCEEWCLLLSTLSKCWAKERGRKNSCLTLFKKISLFRQIWDFYFYVVCTCLCGCMHLWGCTSQYGELDPAQLERQMFVGPGCWDLNSGPHYWAAVALNHSAVPLALDLQCWKRYSFLLLLLFFILTTSKADVAKWVQDQGDMVLPWKLPPLSG